MTALNRIIINTPAVTNVDECTKEETGVGAAIAAGNQEEKGTWALLVEKATRRIHPKNKIDFIFVPSQSKKKIKKEIPNKKKYPPND